MTQIYQLFTLPQLRYSHLMQTWTPAFQIHLRYLSRSYDSAAPQNHDI
jgi:hypothetical protein